MFYFILWSIAFISYSLVMLHKRVIWNFPWKDGDGVKPIMVCDILKSSLSYHIYSVYKITRIIHKLPNEFMN